MIPPLMVHCGVGLLTAGLAIPLVRRKVPMNRVYGVRIAKAFASDRDWYEINAYGGKAPLGYGPVLSSFGLILPPHAPPPSSDRGSPPFVWGPRLLVVPPPPLPVAYTGAPPASL